MSNAIVGGMMAEMAESWTPKQIRLQEWLSLPRYERVPPTQELLADELGIGWRTITRWKKKPGFAEAVNAIARAGLEKSLPEVYGALIREAEKGSIQHIRLVLELVGALGPEVEDSRTQIAIVFNDKSIQALPRELEPDMESAGGFINLLPIQYDGLRTEDRNSAGTERDGDD